MIMSLIDSWMAVCPKGEFAGVKDQFSKTITLQRIFDLHSSLAPSQFLLNLVWTHSKIVAAIVFALCQRSRERKEEGVDISVMRFGARAASGLKGMSSSLPHLRTLERQPNITLAVAGALVHDVGAYKVSKDGYSFDDSYLFHGLYGYLELHKAGFGEEMALFARNHTGSGITRQEVVKENLLLPPQDYLPVTVEQKVVAYGDCFHTKSNPPAFVSFEEAEKRIARFGKGPKDRFEEMAAQFGKVDLLGISQECQMPILGRQLPSCGQ